MVLAFTGAWTGGDLVFDGPGHTLWVRLALDNSWLGGSPWWLKEMWSGTPVWGLAPSFPILNLVPFAALFGADHAVKLAAIASQVAAGWGAMVLARSLWGRTPAAIVAGIMYALHPIVVVHGALWGEQEVLGVMAATPWLLWSLLAALRGRGRRWVALAGLLSGFVLLQQAEYIYGPLLVCALVFVTELRQALHDGGLRQMRALLGRAAGVGGIGAGLAAYWLLPFSKLSNSFVLTPPSWVRIWLTGDIGTRVGNPALFLSLPASVHGPVTFNTVDAFNTGIFYLSWVCVLLSLVTIVVLARRTDRTLSAVLLGTWLALWTSMGGIALSQRSFPGGTLSFVVVVGVVSGLLAGAFLRNLGFGRFAKIAAVIVVVGLFAAPYIAPFLAAQAVVPLLKTVRFPRLFGVAPLGLALAAAYPLTLIPGFLARRPVRVHPVRVHPGRVTVVASIVVISLFLIDIMPIRSLYFLHPPDTSQADARVAASLAATSDDYRVWSPIDPRTVDAVLRTGRDLSSGWPHPLASPDVLHLSYESAFTPPGYRDAALGLSATGYIVLDSSDAEIQGAGRSTPANLNSVTMIRNPKVLPIVRAYDQAVVVHDTDIAPDLAVTLSQHNIGVVDDEKGVAGTMQGVTRAVVTTGHSCREIVKTCGSEPSADYAAAS